MTQLQNSHKKYFLFASDERSYLDLINVSIELENKGLPYFFLYSLSQERSFSFSSFTFKTNVNFEEKFFIKQLNISLPFDPDIIILSNENWDPEKSIIGLFKQLGKYIACVETSSYIGLNISSKLELMSRNSFPTNCVDVFFDHSEWSRDNKIICGLRKSKSVVTGNPKYDSLDLIFKDVENTIVILGVKENNTRRILFQSIPDIIKQFPNHKIYYKPHPVEHLDFPKDFDSKTLLPFNIPLIKHHKDLEEKLFSCDYVVSIIQSILYLPLSLNKKIILIENQFNPPSTINNFSAEITESRFKFWQRILNIKDFNEFQNKIGQDFIDDINKRNKLLINDFKKNCLTLKNLNKNYNNSKLLHYFNFKQDQKASFRIIQFLENEFKK